AAGTSANPCAVFYPGVAVNWQPATTFYYMGFSHSRKLLDTLSADHTIAQDPCGMMLFPKPSDKAGHFAKVMAGMLPHAEVFQHVPAEEMAERIGLPVQREGVFFPHGGWVDVKEYVGALLAHPAITLRMEDENFDNAPAATKVICDGGWRGTVASGLSQHIHPVQGQLSFVTQAKTLSGLRTVLSYGGYVAPMGDGYWLGATFERDGIGSPPDVLRAAADNLSKLDWLLDAPSGIEPAQTGWVGVRSVSRDRMPIVGEYGEDTYVSIAHASRGLLSCGLAAEYIASLIAGEPSPLPRSLARLISPERFKS
ncbi:MAG: FAD-dependent oxidoreductase, partial [Alphaproteobacteria bacterium]|nr:FAD-dependent oxidoreductase [Alphaproteobacteria bacterium]